MLLHENVGWLLKCKAGSHAFYPFSVNPKIGEEHLKHSRRVLCSSSHCVGFLGFQFRLESFPIYFSILFSLMSEAGVNSGTVTSLLIYIDVNFSVIDVFGKKRVINANRKRSDFSVKENTIKYHQNKYKKTIK